MNLFDRIFRIKTEECSGSWVLVTGGGHGQVPKCAMVNLWRGVDAGA